MSIEDARRVLELEAQSILDLIPRLGPEFVRAVDMIYQCSGRVVVAGIGKSGIIGRKIVATLNSTGTPSLFLHPVEAMHGDLGMVSGNDILLALSNSGETDELNAILPCIRQVNAGIISLTGNMHSTLARASDVAIDVGVEREACPLNLAPTSSTTAMLAMGDALAVTLINRRKFNEKDFQRFHPGGRLGERLSNLRVKEVMFEGERIPMVRMGSDFMSAVEAIDRQNLGVVLVVDDDGELQGILTDGDLRRAIKTHPDLRSLRVEDIMGVNPITIHENTPALEALDLMERKEITCLVTVDKDHHLRGLVHLHDLLGRGTFRFTKF
jgi:arabinose-5-phosphate isomerase